jgi:hypothetical protein
MPHTQTRCMSPGMLANVKIYPAPIILEYMSNMTYINTTPKHIIKLCKDRIRRYDSESSQT